MLVSLIAVGILAFISPYMAILGSLVDLADLGRLVDLGEKPVLLTLPTLERRGKFAIWPEICSFPRTTKWVGTEGLTGRAMTAGMRMITIPSGDGGLLTLGSMTCIRRETRMATTVRTSSMTRPHNTKRKKRPPRMIRPAN